MSPEITTHEVTLFTEAMIDVAGTELPAEIYGTATVVKTTWDNTQMNGSMEDACQGVDEFEIEDTVCAVTLKCKSDDNDASLEEMYVRFSTDSKTFFTLEIFWLIDPIRKLLMDIDLSESTLIVLLNGLILSLIFNEKLLDCIKFMKIENQNNALSLLMILIILLKCLLLLLFVLPKHKICLLCQINFLHYDQ